jgi:putative DNA primase/helicase
MTFTEFAHEHGIDLVSVYPSDRIRRCGTINKPKSDNGAYYYDGRKGWVMNWETDLRPVWWESDREWTEKDRNEWKSFRDKQREVSDKKHEDAAAKANEILLKAKLDNHQYLDFKGFPDEKGLVLDEKLYIPMRNVTNNALQGYQTIWWNMSDRKYEKKMMPGMKAKDAVFSMGRSGAETWLVEGYATGLSLRSALKSIGLDSRVIVTFSANNLVNIAPKLKGTVYVFADNDLSQTGQSSAEKTGFPWTMADEPGWDANDLHYKKGIFSVVAKIQALKNKLFLENVA